MTGIYECGTISRQQYSQRADGQWFERFQEHSRYGYRWTKWRPCSNKPERAGLNSYAGNARLPANIGGAA